MSPHLPDPRAPGHISGGSPILGAPPARASRPVLPGIGVSLERGNGPGGGTRICQGGTEGLGGNRLGWGHCRGDGRRHTAGSGARTGGHTQSPGENGFRGDTAAAAAPGGHGEHGEHGEHGLPPPRGSALRSPRPGLRDAAPPPPPCAAPLHPRRAPTPPPRARRCHPRVSPLAFPSPYLRLLGRRRPLCRCSSSPSPPPPPLPAAPAAASREWGG